MSKFIRSAWGALLVATVIPSYGETIKIKQGSDLQSQIQYEGVRYVFKGDYDLNGEEIRVPRDAVLDLRNATVRNGIIIGLGDNLIKFKKPFLGDSIIVTGCCVNDRILEDGRLIIDVKHVDSELHNLIGLARDGATVRFSKGEFADVTRIELKHDINLDFSGSIIRTMMDEYNLSSTVFYMTPWEDLGLDHISISNVTIDGQYPIYGLESGVGPRRCAIQFFYVKDVELKNVHIKNFRFGTGGEYANNLRERYMAGVCSIMEYRTCTITGCSISMSSGEGFFLVPQVNPRNYCLFKGNRAIKFHGTFLTLIDGQCLVEDNTVDKFGLSGMNVFCHNSVIRNNQFQHGERFNCMDLTENGMYIPSNVQIYGNIASDCEGFIMVAGNGISIHNNKLVNPKSGFALTVYGKNEEWREAFNNVKRSSADFDGIEIYSNQIQGKGGISTYKGCKAQLNIHDNVITVIPDKDKPELTRGTAIELIDVTNVSITRNTFVNSFRNAITRANTFITVNASKGVSLTIEKNAFSFDKYDATGDGNNFFFTYKSTLASVKILNNKSNIANLKYDAGAVELLEGATVVIKGNGAMNFKRFPLGSKKVKYQLDEKLSNIQSIQSK